MATFIAPAVLCLAACDSVRPSTFTSGWNDPAPAAVVDARHDGEQQENEQEQAWEQVEPDRAPPLGVLDDWRLHHEGASPCPPEMARIDDYCIDRWEASLVEVTPKGVVPFAHNARPARRNVRAVSRPNVMPQGYISGAEAQRACEMAGKRLCTDHEWFRACEGKHKTIYPYGTVLDKHRCNGDRKLHPMHELYGPAAGDEIWMVEPMNNPAINEQPDTVAPTGAMVRCVGSWGIHDMVGNLQEWTNDPAGTFRGGAYSTNNALGCQYVTTVHGLGYHDYSIGFRCCSDPYAP